MVINTWGAGWGSFACFSCFSFVSDVLLFELAKGGFRKRRDVKHRKKKLLKRRPFTSVLNLEEETNIPGKIEPF